MRKIYLILIVFLIVPCYANAQSTPSFSMPESIVDYGQTQVDVAISFHSDGAVSALQFDITYDNSVITAGDVALDTIIDNHTLVSNEITPGTHRVVIYASGNDSITDQMIITIPFEVLAFGTQTALEFSNIVLSDNDAMLIAPAHVENGSVTLLSEDTDNDGMPDAWEKQYVFCLCVMSGTSDYDNDGFKDVFEYHADTDPTDPDSLLKMSEVETDEMPQEKKCIIITWTCEPEKNYKIFWRDVLSDSDWDEVDYHNLEDDIIDNSDGTQSWTDTGKDPQMNGQVPSDSSSRFYKVVVALVE